MSGVVAALLATTSLTPAAPLTNGYGWSGNNSVTVTGSSGNAYVSGYPSNVIGGGAYGGTDPISVSFSANASHAGGPTNSGGPHASIGGSPDGVHSTIFYSNLAVGEVMSVDVYVSMHDSSTPQQTAGGSIVSGFLIYRSA